MNVFLLKLILILTVAVVVGGATYIVLTILEAARKDQKS